MKRNARGQSWALADNLSFSLFTFLIFNIMKMPVRTYERPVYVDGRIWIVYVKVFKTIKHVYIKPRGWEFYTFDFVLKGKEYNQDAMYHACQVIRGL